jgi:hypothetical protein
LLAATLEKGMSLSFSDNRVSKLTPLLFLAYSQFWLSGSHG